MGIGIGRDRPEDEGGGFGKWVAAVAAIAALGVGYLLWNGGSGGLLDNLAETVGVTSSDGWSLTAPANIFENASIRHDGGFIPEDDGPGLLFIVETGGQPLWFAPRLEFATNRHDAWVRIDSFGLVDKTDARSGPTSRRKFTQAEAAQIQAMLEHYFSGDATSEKYGAVSLVRGPRPFLGVKFAPGWITIV